MTAWERAQDTVTNAVTLCHSQEVKAILLFPDDSEEHWGCLLTQVPQSELDAKFDIEDMSHEPLGFLSGAFRDHSYAGLKRIRKASLLSALFEGWSIFCVVAFIPTLITSTWRTSSILSHASLWCRKRQRSVWKVGKRFGAIRLHHPAHRR